MRVEPIDEDELDEDALTATKLFDTMRGMMAGIDPDVQGAIVVQMMALYVACHAPPMRKEVMETMVDAAFQLMEVNIEEMIESGMVGEEWRGTSKKTH